MRYISLLRCLVIVAFIGGIELLCRAGIIDNFTMQPPSRIAQDLWRLLAKGALNKAIIKTLTNSAIGLVMAVSAGILTGVLIHRLRLLREALDPLFATYYAIPVLAFYPLLIILFGLGDAPQIIIAFMLGLLGWVLLNTDVLPRWSGAFDPYPYIFLNLILSMLAAIQAPIIMMSQNRQAAKDRLAASIDFEVNLRPSSRSCACTTSSITPSSPGWRRWPSSRRC